jgi:crotonobetainyl-CoA:carnitine CoA-transferase CaiB-like acyl-CoA transferase
MIQSVPHAAAGPVKVLGTPIKLSRTPGAVHTPPPRLGEHTAAVLRDLLDLAPGEIARLSGDGVIGVAE